MVVKKGRSANSSRRTDVRKNAIIASIESSRPSRTYSSSNSGESGSGKFSTTCRRHQTEPGKGGSQRASSNGGGGKLVIGRACKIESLLSASAHSTSCGDP